MLVAQRKIQEEVWIPAISGCEGNARGGLKQVPAVHQYIQHWYATTHPENSSVMIAHGWVLIAVGLQVGAARSVRSAVCAGEGEKRGGVAAGHPLPACGVTFAHVGLLHTTTEFRDTRNSVSKCVRARETCGKGVRGTRSQRCEKEFVFEYLLDLDIEPSTLRRTPWCRPSSCRSWASGRASPSR